MVPGVLTRIQAALRGVIRADAERVGPFPVRFDAHSEHLVMNCAVPDEDAAPTRGDVDALVAAFRSRTPRLEYLRPSTGWSVRRTWRGSGRCCATTG